MSKPLPQSTIVFVQVHVDNRYSHRDHQLFYVNAINEGSKRQKIRTYIDYEKDFVRLHTEKCYSCYAFAAVIATAICLEIWSNIKDSIPFHSVDSSDPGEKSTEATNEEKGLNGRDQGDTTAKPYYLKRFEYMVK